MTIEKKEGINPDFPGVYSNFAFSNPFYGPNAGNDVSLVAQTQ